MRPSLPFCLFFYMALNRFRYQIINFKNKNAIEYKGLDILIQSNYQILLPVNKITCLLFFYTSQLNFRQNFPRQFFWKSQRRRLGRQCPQLRLRLGRLFLRPLRPEFDPWRQRLLWQQRRRQKQNGLVLYFCVFDYPRPVFHVDFDLDQTCSNLLVSVCILCNAMCQGYLFFLNPHISSEPTSGTLSTLSLDDPQMAYHNSMSPKI